MVQKALKSSALRVICIILGVVVDTPPKFIQTSLPSHKPPSGRAMSLTPLRQHGSTSISKSHEAVIERLAMVLVVEDEQVFPGIYFLK